MAAGGVAMGSDRTVKPEGGVEALVFRRPTCPMICSNHSIRKQWPDFSEFLGILILKRANFWRWR
jgi:hypothetical protein